MSSSNDSKPDNYSINAKICRLVERFPCMYDRSHPQYLKKDVVDRAWLKIAKDMDDSIPSCKERWRNIRTSFARSINVNKIPASANRTKPYYLHEELRFLARHITPGIPVSRRSNICCSAGEESEVVEVAVGEESFDGFAAMMHDDDDSEGQQSSNDESSSATKREQLQLHHLQLKKTRRQHHHQQPDQQQQQQQEQPHFSPNQSNNNHHQQQEDEEQEPQHEQVIGDVCEQVATPPQQPSMSLYPPKKRARMLDAIVVEPEREPDVKLEYNQEGDFDAVFLQNLLPEMKAMDFKQKLIFKRRIYEVIAEVFDSPPSPRLTNAPPLNTSTTINTVNKTYTCTPVPNAPTMTLVSAADMAMIRRLNALLQNPHTVHSVNSIPKSGPSISSTVRTTPPTATVALHRGAVTRSGSNLLRVTMVNPPAAVPTPSSIPAVAPSPIVKQEPVASDD